MVQDQGINVYLAPFGDITKRYPEYAVPIDSPVHTNNPNEVYIEAVDGERFVIVVDLLEDFDAYESTSVQVRCVVDGDATSRISSYSALDAKTPSSASVKGRSVHEFAIRKFEGRWVKCGYSFLLLEMDEEMDMDEEQVSRSIELHGKISVTLRRGGYVMSSAAERQMFDNYQAPNTAVSSKAVVKDNHVSHAIKHVFLEESKQPGICGARAGYRWERIRGQRGDDINFTFRYRSRDALQKLKIVPKDQSHVDLTTPPPSSPQVKHEDGDTFIKSESIDDDHITSNIEQELALSPEEAQTQPAAGTSTDVLHNGPTLQAQNDKKRKALQAQLRDIELEQKRLRVLEELAQMDGAEI